MNPSPLNGLRQRYSRRYPHRLPTCSVLWALDFIGTILAGSGLLRRRPLPRTGAPAILLIRNDQIGDAVMATAAIGPILRHYPGARLAMMVHTSAAPLFRADGRLAQVIALRTPWFTTPRPGIVRAIRETLGAMAQVRRGRFELVIDLRGDIRNIILFGRASSRAAILSYADVTAGAGWVDHPVAYRAMSEIGANLRLLSAAGIDCGGAATRLSWSQESIKEVERLIGRGEISRRMLVGIHPGASWKYRCWPAERFNTVARWLEEHYGARIIVTGTGDEFAIAEKVCVGLRHGLNLAGKLPLQLLPSLVERLCVLIANDTSVVHIAAAVETPVIVLWGAGDLQKFGNNYPHATVLCKATDCRPCPQRVCPRPDDWCLGRITVDDALAAVRSVLGTARGRRGSVLSSRKPQMAPGLSASGCPAHD